jgi:spore coat polysaccharide biosynthesis protein SpsF
MKNVAIISQARLTSTRLPQKILMKIKEKTLLEIHINNLKKADIPIIIATPSDNFLPISKICKETKVATFQGDEHDVLSRFYNTAKQFNIKTIIRVTSDCPFIDGKQLKNALLMYQSFNDSQLFFSNTLERSFPRGFDFEIFDMSMLEEAHKHAIQQHEREHVTPFIYEKAKIQKKIKQFINDTDYSSLRLTVDTIEDFKLVETMIKDYNADKLCCDEICQLMKKNPTLAEINKHIEQKKIV